MRVDQTAQWQPLPGDENNGGAGWLPPEPPPVDRRPLWRRMLARVRLKHVVLGLLAFIMLTIAWLAITAPLSKSLQPIAAPTLTLVSAEGEPIARRGADIRAPIQLARLPKHVPAAFVSIEDKRFYHHWGISLRGIARAAWRNLGAGGVREGGSTITQQLAKTSFLSSERTMGRKAQEVLIAFWLEAWLTKPQILERYLSNVYFGDNVYGLRAAAHHYFSVEPEQLSVAQAAMLAGMVRAPSRLAPTHNLKLAQARAKVVIGAMVRDGAITARQARALRPASLRVERQRAVPTGTYFADWVLPAARARVEQEGDDAYGQQTVPTTLESRLQRAALQSIRNAGLGRAQVALVAMRPDGKVVAMVGGKDYSRSPFNRATQARRQPGSTFKLFVYLAAMRAGMRPDDPIEDKPLRIGNWQPKNYGDRYRGTMTLRDAFAQSSNVAAVRLSEKVGRRNVIQAARDLGVTSPLNDNPSLALGTSGVTLVEMVQAYAAVAAGAYPVRAHGLEDPAKPWWQRMWQNYAGKTRDPAFAEMKDLLGAVVQQGTGRAASLAIPVYGKTGTSQDYRDALFIGFTDDLVVGVWVGNDDNSSLGGIAGGSIPARIFRDFTAAAENTRPVQAAAPPPEDPVIEEGDANLAVPIGGTGYEVGVDVGNEGVTVSARPSADGEQGPPPEEDDRGPPMANGPPPPPRDRPPPDEDDGDGG
ncbi:MAG: transglycosylase domain-containing protein [Allosphingosinicella sp.]